VGRRNLKTEDQPIYWAVYGLEEILSTKYSEETELIQLCKGYLASLKEYVVTDFSNEATSSFTSLDALFLPLSSNKDILE
jgi:hypothetical protein